jgi:phytoene dehydrogenase-like protein
MAIERMRVAVVGAGAGGLVAATYLAKAGIDVDVFEAQDHVGGCASCFSIGGHRFHAGATTLVGLERGMPLERILSELSIDLPHHVLDGSLAIAHGGDRFIMTPSTDTNVRSLASRYGEGLGAFWRFATELAPKAWSLIGEAPLPPRTLGDLLSLAERGDAWRLLPELLRTTDSRLRGFGPTSPSGHELLNELLLVSTQSTAAATPALFGAMGCEYLQRRLYMPVGGLGSLFDRLAQRIEALGGRVHRRSPVDAVRDDGDSVNVRVAGESHRFDAIVMGITCWDAARIAEGHIKRFFARQAKTHTHAWSAAGGYFIYDDTLPEDYPVYTQVILDAPMASTGARGLFVTLPPRADSALVTPGTRTMTVSCHTAPESWFSCTHNEFMDRRDRLVDEVQAAIRGAIPELRQATCRAAHPVTPRTWQTFTGRHLGRVGGLPFERNLRTLAYPTGRTPSPRVICVGDTVFPGQSVTATAIGARRGALELVGRVVDLR